MTQIEQHRKLDLLIAGVGGQGAILASDIIGKAAVAAGLPIKQQKPMEWPSVEDRL